MQLPPRPSVLLLTRSWHGHGGMQRFSRDMADMLTADSRIDCTVIYPRRAGILSLFFFCIRAIRQSCMQRHSYVHSMDASLLPLSVLCSLFGRSSLTLTAHGLDIVYAKPWYQAMLTLFLPRVCSIAVVSKTTKKQLQKRGVPTKKIHVIPCSVPLVPLATHSKKPTQLVTVGRLIERKGVLWFVEEVLPLLNPVQQGISYHIVGDGPMRPNIEQSIARLGLQNVVTLHGACSEQERITFMQESALCIAPNIPVEGDMEGFGVVCIEASNVGTQVLASNLEGLQDSVIDGKTGQHFAAQDAASCADTLMSMLQSPLDPRTVQKETQAHFSKKSMADSYSTLMFHA